MTHNTRPVIIMLYFATIMCLVTSLPASMNLPLVDPGLFVISGVKTCGDNSGYCLLGSDCTADDDFLPDPLGNCDGLKRAFTPSAPFVCCKFNKKPIPSGIPIKDSDIKKFTSANTNDELARNARENIDESKMESEQLAKLNQIELVVKKIIEQFINETANSIKTNETTIDNQTNMEENTMRNEIREQIIKDEIPMIANNQTEINETTTNPIIIIKSDETETTDDESSRTEIPSENKENTEENKVDIIQIAETEESSTMMDDEFKADKNICQKTCKSEVTFLVDKKPMCYGTLLDDIWILTSATCASRLNKADIRKVTVSRKESIGTSLNISNILVHENFKSPVSKNPPENNDLALASLTVPLQGEACIPCFSQKSSITNEVCKTFQTTTYKNAVKSAEVCEGQVQQRKLISNSYLVLPCFKWRMQYNVNQEGRLGSGLWCDGKLAGVQTGVGVGSLIYTPVNEYVEWISDNKRIEKRR
ncbi:Peptidase S1, PA clan,Serine proteases, trypsin domain [Cinara cedri]|uniref:Peptidase S1, PA clan,Serine proteases, trypsin domain n=1 Tax=Cinara cedri TaxID=506608 RepID=A0A5E4M7X5_9HEMI|nr:Peptidase S1, PA clan,Serine proteases, trypsin domain [Cinara cedri]